MAPSDRALTIWAAAGSTAAVAVVGVVAALGGLEAAPEPQPATVAVGTPFDSAPLTVTVRGARLVDALPADDLVADPGMTIVALRVEVVNAWDQPQLTGLDSSLSGVVTVEGLGEPDMVVRADDGEIGPVLQPGVPVTVLLAWQVDADRFAAGDALRVSLADMTLYTASFVTSGQWWTDPVTQAVTTVELGG